MDRACSTHGIIIKRPTYKIFIGISEGKRALGITMHRLKDNIKMDLTKDRGPMISYDFWFHIGQAVS
jgi:hypothetical protein